MAKDLVIDFAAEGMQPVVLNGAAGTATAVVSAEPGVCFRFLKEVAGVAPNVQVARKISLAEEVWASAEKGSQVPAGKRRIGWVPAVASLFPHWSVERNLQAGLRRGDGDRRLEELRDLCGLSADRTQLPGALPPAERFRAACARALAQRPDFLLVEDPSLPDDLLEKELPVLRRLFSQCGAAVLFATDRPGPIVGLFDNLLFFSATGEAALLPMEDALQNPPNGEIASRLGFENKILAEVSQQPNSDGVQVKIGEHSLVAKNGSSLPAGPIGVLFRAADLRLLPRESAGNSNNCLRGICKTALRDSKGWTVIVDCGFEVTLRLPPSEIPPGDGSRCHVHFPPEAFQFLQPESL